MEYYAHRAYVIMAIDGDNRWDIISFDQFHKEIRLLDESVFVLTLERDSYLH